MKKWLKALLIILGCLIAVWIIWNLLTMKSIDDFSNQPLCGKVNVQCVTTPCDPVEETFLSRTEAEERGAFDIRLGPCITNFEECIAAGNPAMESYPRQCRDPFMDITYTEEIEVASPTPGSPGEPSNCIQEGSQFSSLQGPNMENTTCCEGLDKISGGWMYRPETGECNPYPPVSGSTPICSNCGNNICEEWENKCSCPEDCRSSPLSPEECEDLGGTPLNIVGGAECSENERNVGEVVGFISPNICCVPK